MMFSNLLLFCLFACVFFSWTVFALVSHCRSLQATLLFYIYENSETQVISFLSILSSEHWSTVGGCTPQRLVQLRSKLNKVSQHIHTQYNDIRHQTLDNDVRLFFFFLQNSSLWPHSDQLKLGMITSTISSDLGSSFACHPLARYSNQSCKHSFVVIMLYAVLLLFTL